MGCTSSSLSGAGRPLGRKNRKLHHSSSRRSQRQSIYVVSNHASPHAYVNVTQDWGRNRVRSWSPQEIEALCDEAVWIVQDDHTSWPLSEKGGERLIVHKEAEEEEEGQQAKEVEATKKNKKCKEATQPRKPTPSTPPTPPLLLCTEQERRLRCANLEVFPGMAVLDSDDEDQEEEEEGFEFANNPNPNNCVNEALTDPPSDKPCSSSNEAPPMEWEREEHQLNEASSSPLSLSTPNYLDSPASLLPIVSSPSSFGGYSDQSPETFTPSPAMTHPMSDSFTEAGCDYSPLSFTSEGYSSSEFGSQNPLSSETCSPLVVSDDQPGSLSSSLLASPFSDSSLIPGLPDDLAQLCLMRVPSVKYDRRIRMVCRRWGAVLSSAEFYSARKALGISEAHVCFVVHGNKVQVFNVRARNWTCLPPLPHPDEPLVDPYTWWQIDTVAATSDGALFVIGGDEAEIQPVMRPSKPTRRVHRYDFCLSRWVPVAAMRVPRSHAAAVPLGPRRILVAGGSEDPDDGRSAEVYDSINDTWTFAPFLNSSMRKCVGMESGGGRCYVKGENAGPGNPVEGETYNSLAADRGWERVRPGMARGLARGPVASADSSIYVADWKDSELKVYEAEHDAWRVVAKLHARISRLVGHGRTLYGLTGKIKVNIYNHHVVADAPAEVWKLDLGRGGGEGGEGLDCYSWECLWRDPKQMVKTGSLEWAPCISQCTLFED